jgi:phosphoribosyl-AMP cyclohydrolase
VDKLLRSAGGRAEVVDARGDDGYTALHIAARMNRASLEKTLETRKTWFWSRSRKKFWMKGESSGHTQSVRDVAFDCDGDVLLIQVEQVGAACHEGFRSCFFRSLEGAGCMFHETEGRLETPEAIYGRK